MADYSYIKSSFWTDPENEKLPPEAKLVFLYLISNPLRTQCGIYKISPNRIAYNTGYPIDTVSKAIDTLSREKKIKYDGLVVWVINFFKHQANSSPKVLKRVAKELEELGSHPYVKEFLEYYKDYNIPYEYPIDTVSEGYPKKEKEKEKEKENKINNKSRSKERAVKDPRVKELIDYYSEHLKEKLGILPSIPGGHMGKFFKSQLRALEKNEVEDPRGVLLKTIDLFFQDNSPFVVQNGYSFSIYTSKFQGLLTDVLKGKKPRRYKNPSPPEDFEDEEPLGLEFLEKGEES